MAFDLISRIAGTVLPLVALVIVGLIYARRRRPNLDDANRANMDLFTPALVFSILVGGDFELTDMAGLAGATVAMVLSCACAAAVVARLAGLDWRVLVLSSTFRNSGNIGLPLAVLAFGTDALPAATVVFLTGNLIHFFVGAWLLNGASSWRDVLGVPVVTVSLVAVAIKALAIPVPDIAMIPIRMLGEITIPLMLFSLGVRLAGSDFSQWRIGLIAGISMPLTGLLAYALIVPWFTLTPFQIAALLAYAVLPSAVLNFMFAERYAYKPTEVASIIAVSHLVGLATLPLMLAWALTRLV